MCQQLGCWHIIETTLSSVSNLDFSERCCMFGDVHRRDWGASQYYEWEGL